MADDLPEDVTCDTAKALVQSKKFWITLAGTIVTLLGYFGYVFTPEQAVAMGMAGFIIVIFLLAFASKTPIDGLLKAK